LACFYETYGGPSVDQVGMIAKPGDLKEGQLLLEVHAASLNPADYKQRSGGMKLLLSSNFPQVHGFDFSGVVVTSNSTLYAEGDEVFGMVKGLRRGSLAEFMVVDADICAKKPSSVSHKDAACVPLVGITSIMAFRKCGLKENDATRRPRILVTGGAGGVGSLAIQLAKKLYNASFVATTASPGAKTDFVKSIGADQVVDYRSENMVDVLRSDDESLLFDAIFDCTGEAKKLPELLRSGGGLVSIQEAPTSLCINEWLEQSETSEYQHITFGVRGFLGSSIGGGLVDFVTGAKRLTKQCQKRQGTFAHVIGTGNGEIMGLLKDLLERNEIVAVIDSQFELANALEAVARIESGHAQGKVIVNAKK